jgi:hypothetical protein
MADAFQPKFVDLVRNSTTSTGIGNFTLGPPVAGYTSFTAACQVGDRFYYSAVSTDKPAEHEVGRGTLLAGGIINREPISGAKTNFSNGTKSVALIAAADWYQQAQQLMAASSRLPLTAMDRAALAAAPTTAAAVLGEHGREGLFTWAIGDRTAGIAADPKQGVTIAAATDASGASGAWVRNHSGPLNVRWFGALGDGVADDSPAFIAAIAYLKASATNINGPYKASPRLFVPAGEYFLGAATLDITHTLIIEGEGSGLLGNSYPAKLRWADGATGIRIQGNDTSGVGTVDADSHSSGAGSRLCGLHLYGGYGGAESESHGIHAKAHIAIEHCVIENFAGDGIYVHADIVSSGSDHGNANMGLITNVSVRGCRDGTSMQGGDANAWTITHLTTSANRRWGRYDDAFLSNVYIGGESDTNGLIPGTPPSVVSDGGNRYAIVDGQESAGAATAPAGTADSATWLYLGPGGENLPFNIQAWTSGMALRAGGAARYKNFGSPKLVLGLYSESAQGPVQATYPTVLIGGSTDVRGTGVYLRNQLGMAAFGSVGAAIDGLNYTALMPTGVEFQTPTNSVSFEWMGNDLAATVFRSGVDAAWFFRLTGENTSANVGKRRLDFPNGFGLGDRKILPGTGAPTSGTYVQGDRVWNTAPSVGNPKSWVCTASGSPGSWVSEGNL